MRKSKPASRETMKGDLRALRPGTLFVRSQSGEGVFSVGHRLAALRAIDVRTRKHEPTERMDMIADLFGRLADMDDFEVQVMLVTDLDPHECGRA